MIVEFRHQPTAVHLRTFINRRYKLTVYRDRPYGELFDLQEDPAEVKNRWHDPAAVGLKSQLLHEFMQATLRDEPMRMQNLLLWNFSASPVAVELSLTGLVKDTRIRHISLDAMAASDDENARLRPEPFATLKKGDQRLTLKFDPYAVHYWSFE